MRRQWKTLLAVCFLVLGLTVLSAQAATVSWTPPDSRVDGTPLDPGEIQFYELCASATATPACATPYVFETTSTAVPIESLDLDYGTWYFTVRTVDTDGLTSEWAPSVAFQQVAPPNPPMGLLVE